MGCDWCKNADLGLYCADVTDNKASISVLLDAEICRLPRDNQFRFCPMCGKSLTEPKPLALDELRKRVEKPVWLITGVDQASGSWEVLERITSEPYRAFWFTRRIRGLLVYDYSETWMTYDRPPKGE